MKVINLATIDFAGGGSPVPPVPPTPDPYEAVDLGLPSGKLWASVNVGASKFFEPGLFFSWGNIVGHEYESGYNFSESNYGSTPGAAITTNLPIEYDAARAVMGGGWRTPTEEEFNELQQYTDKTDINIKGVIQVLFMSKTDPSKYIIIPQYGNYNGTTLDSYSYYWTTKLISYDNSQARVKELGINGFQNNNVKRYRGLLIRAVKDPG